VVARHQQQIVPPDMAQAAYGPEREMIRILSRRID
jgi:hypothetical protein